MEGTTHITDPVSVKTICNLHVDISSYTKAQKTKHIMGWSSKYAKKAKMSGRQRGRRRKQHLLHDFMCQGCECASARNSLMQSQCTCPALLVIHEVWWTLCYAAQIPLQEWRTQTPGARSAASRQSLAVTPVWKLPLLKTASLSRDVSPSWASPIQWLVREEYKSPAPGPKSSNSKGSSQLQNFPGDLLEFCVTLSQPIFFLFPSLAFHSCGD